MEFFFALFLLFVIFSIFLSRAEIKSLKNRLLEQEKSNEHLKRDLFTLHYILVQTKVMNVHGLNKARAEIMQSTSPQNIEELKESPSYPQKEISSNASLKSDNPPLRLVKGDNYKKNTYH